MNFLIHYPEATHAFDRGLGRGLTDRTREGYTYRLDQYAKEDAWNRTLSWFRKYLAQ